ncbi:MAG: PTS ascorbate transporter subunit IIC [Anaerolineales bacterium]|nr:PTS ascorbate transporter subunit IIC [Anaerolineales bacterium]MBS3753115.1 PTS ascorbate transporter subunit IIC [Anaerolineales bacterium]
MTGILKTLVDILSVPALLVGIVAFLGYLATKGKNFSDALAGGTKASIGFFILGAGATTLIGPLDVLGPMLQDAFNVQGVVPSNEAIVAIALGQLAQATALIMVLGFAFNIIFARFTPFKYIWLTGHHSLYMASLLAAAFSVIGMSGAALWLVGGVVLGFLQVLMPAWTQHLATQVAGDDEWSIGHFSSLSYVVSGFAARVAGGDPETTSAEDLSFPKGIGFLRESLVATGLIMFLIFIVPALFLGSEGRAALGGDTTWWVYLFIQALTFSAGVAAVLYGVRTILGEIVPAFTGFADKIVPDAKPALDIPVVFPFGANSVIIGFLTSFLAGLVMLFIMGPIGLAAIVPGLVPHFFVGGGAGVIGNAFGGRRGAVIAGIVNGVIISLGAALLLPALGNLGFENTTYGDADFQWVGILIGLIGGLFGG